MPDAGYKIQDAGCRMPDAGYRMQEARWRILDNIQIVKRSGAGH